MKTERKEEELNVKYKGVRRRKWGVFVAEIRDPKNRNNRWLGTFPSAIEAAKAYDKAAIEIRGTKATLNLPLHFQSEPITVVRSTRKRKKDTSDTIKHKELDKAPSENGKRQYFKWTDEALVTMCNILKKHHIGDAQNYQSKWDDFRLEFEKVCNHKFKAVSALTSKYDEMTKKYNLWKLLKKGETGLRWNQSTGELDCSDDWWEKKLKENPEFIKIRKKQPSKELQEAWDRLFENSAVVGVDCLTPSEVSPEIVVAKWVDGVAPCDLNKSNHECHVNEVVRDDDGLDIYVQNTQHSSQFGNLENGEATSFSSLINGERQGDGAADDGPRRYQKLAKTNTKPKPIQMTSSIRDLNRATIVKRQNATQQAALYISKMPGENQVGDSSIRASINVINRMVDEGLMTSCSDLWCFAVNLFEDNVKRELFMSLRDDVGRLAWLQYKQNLGK